jgi:hypothetical protein
MNLLEYITSEKIMEKYGNYFNDCENIKSAAKLAGYDISTAQASLLWEHYSQSVAAHWLMITENQEQLKNLLLNPNGCDDIELMGI